MLKRTIKRIIINSALSLMLIAMYNVASAEEDIITLVPAVTPIPEAKKAPEPDELEEHELSEDEVETLAEFLWKSPLTDEEQKRTLLWVVFNRAEDQSGKFDNDIEKVCRKESEFGFMESHRFKLSEDNLRIAREELNRWYEKKAGKNIGKHVPAIGLYCSFEGAENGTVQVYAEIGGEPLRW